MGVPDFAPLDGARLAGDLDAERTRRGISWGALAAQLGVSATTMKRVGARGTGEADGVLAMCRWLGRPLEHFAGSTEEGAPRDSDSFGRSGTMLRANTSVLLEAIDAQRDARGASWDDVANELSEFIPFSTSMLRRLSQGGRIEVNSFLLLSAWVGKPAKEFLHLTSV